MMYIDKHGNRTKVENIEDFELLKSDIDKFIKNLDLILFSKNGMEQAKELVSYAVKGLTTHLWNKHSILSSEYLVKISENVMVDANSVESYIVIELKLQPKYTNEKIDIKLTLKPTEFLSV